MPTRHTPAARCAHCRRRVNLSDHMAIEHGDGTSEKHCGQRAACRRACNARNGHVPDLTTRPDTAALGSALITADYIDWPRGCRLAPRAWRDELARRFAHLSAQSPPRQP